MIGQTVSHYKILEKLGEGGMGVVYKAHDVQLDRDVAIKFLPRHVTASAVDRERFTIEARAAAALNHPHIATIYSIEEADDETFLVMEYIDGQELKSRIQSAPLSVEEVVEISRQIADGLQAAHKKGIVHRDIKSSNIMLTGGGSVKIMDFGLAKLKGSIRLTKTSSAVGTPAYMSPEQARGEEVDHRSDIFSFGVVLYELISGQLPFKGLHEAALMYEIVHEHARSLHEIRSNVPDALQKIVDKAMEKDSVRRYQQMDAIVTELITLQKALESGATPRVGGLSIHRLSRKSIWLIPASVVGVVATLLIIFRPTGEEISLEKKTLAVMYFENIPDPEDRDHTGEMLTNLLITSFFQTRNIDVISRERLYDLENELVDGNTKSKNSAFARKVAQRAGASMMLIGSVLQRQPSLAVMYRLIEVSTGRLLSTQRLTGFSSDQIFSMVDSVALLVKNDLKIPTRLNAEPRSVADVTTSSLEAYRSYLEGIELNIKYYGAEAKAAFERAIELDTSFAMAYFQLSQLNYGFRPAYIASDDFAAVHALQKAWSFRERVTERERLAIEAAYASRFEKESRKTIAILQKLLGKYPHEQGEYRRLSLTYRRLGDYDRALQSYLSGLQQDSMDANLWNFLAYDYAALGQRSQALQAAERYLKLLPGSANPYDTKAEVYFAFAEIDSSMLWYQKALELRADFASVEKLGNHALLDRDYESAQKFYQQFRSTADERQQLAAQTDMVLILVHEGRLKQAEKELQRIVQDHERKQQHQAVVIDYKYLGYVAYESGNPDRMVRYARKISDQAWDVMAWASARNGDAAAAQLLLNKLNQNMTGETVLDGSVYHYAAGLVALEEGNYQIAINQFEQALQPLYPNRAGQYFYGMALLLNGRVEEAINELQRVTWWSPIAPYHISLHFLPTAGYWPIAAVKAHYWLGVAYEQGGNRDKAIQEYEKFLEIWKDADFKSKELDDAKFHLSILKG